VKTTSVSGPTYVTGSFPRYVLITPARNEQEHIGRLLDAMLAQTHPPIRWVIVSDASTDRTDEIVARFTRRCHWITLIRMPEHRDRNFAAKVECFNAGRDEVKNLPFDVIGNLDADISFEPDYFSFLLSQFARNSRLGVAGTPFVERGGHYDYRFTSIEHVSGACQLFRRECFEAIGGYVPMRGGGIDWRAVTTARMKGWQTRTFTERTCLHHRSMGTGSTSQLKGLYRHGQKDYSLGGHPLWQVFRCGYQMTRSPYVIGGLSLLCGYCTALLRRTEPAIPRELVTFHRAEQVARLKSFFGRPGRWLERWGAAS
jgi:biofilm PGA synthesis N-glycosyltransferase PgaC